ncbi:MAG: tRNA (N(6)-L-threonylcarbamoyladenosine(37)-C(2))-methylthiotransferase MtaB [Oscillospiraceae bacterium]|nr:tRNA (N(6)-L-threonylcarbamoyladenosine(37)-C(2))-methylthiotransferase MtaB [Oscillospiraceae bacterium]
MTVFFITFGCKVNCYETQCLKEEFIKSGFDTADSETEADVIIINSCTVTSASDKKVRQSIHKMRQENKDAVIVLTGCYPQAFRDEAMKITEADIITGTKNRSRIIELVKKHTGSDDQFVEVSEYSSCDRIDSLRCTSYDNKTRAFVKIQDGCNQFCSYCIIPFSRGRIRSKSLEDLTQEVSTLAANGHQEIVLVGINLAFYGSGTSLGLADAVEACCAIEGVKRVRLGSLEPEKITHSDLVRLSGLEQFCPQFHLSLQSGCDKTLAAMNRKYTCSEYEQLVNDIRDVFPDASITTDIMTGFPGETEEDFEESCLFAQRIRFSKINVFPYSVRVGTRAASMPGQITKKVKSQRAARMSEIGTRTEKEFLRSQIGKIVPVLFEKENCTEYHHGYSTNYTLVKIKRTDQTKSLRNKIFYVKIEESMDDYCIGEIQITE